MRRTWVPDLVAVVFLIVMLGVLLGPATFLGLFNPDQQGHLQFALGTYNSGQPTTPHFLFHYLVIFFYILTGSVNWLTGLFLATLIPQMVLALVIYGAFMAQFQGLPMFQKRKNHFRILSVFLAFALTLITAPFPLTSILSAINPAATYTVHPHLLGLISPNVYHNPTTILLRPLALCLFLIVNHMVIENRERHYSSRQRIPIIMAAALVTLLSGLSKPNYLIALVPALMLWVGWHWLRKQPVGKLTAIWGVLVPAILFLIWQFMFTYVNGMNASATASIVFAPFYVVTRIANLSLPVVFFLLFISLLLPLTVYAVFQKQALRDRGLNFAWLTTLFGISYMYLLAETGDRAMHGNFFWSAYIAVFVLNFASVRLAVSEWVTGKRKLWNWRMLVASGVVALHLVSGLILMDIFQRWIISEFL